MTTQTMQVEDALSVRTDSVRQVAFNPPTEYVGHVEPAEATEVKRTLADILAITEKRKK